MIAAAPEGRSISQVVADWAHGLTFADLPDAIVSKSKLHMLDCIGIAVASWSFDFADKAMRAIRDVSGGQRGPCTVIGAPDQLSARDAAMMNGTLVHGLDFDDTYLPGTLHPSASALATALAIAEVDDLSGRDLILGFALAVEVSARISAAAPGGAFLAGGFQPSGAVAVFGSTVAAGRLRECSVEQLVDAQGFAGSLAAGSMQTVEEGAWTKRAHPGWAAVGGLTAGAFGQAGFVGARQIYEGKHGFFASYLPPDSAVDLDVIVADLGAAWHLADVAIKPYPACQYLHSLADCVLELRNQVGLDEVTRIDCGISPLQIPLVFEPRQDKKAPRGVYEGQFSAPFVVGATLVRGRFTLAELVDEALANPSIRGMAELVEPFADPTSHFPRYHSGRVRITTSDGRVLEHAVEVNRGAAARPITDQEIVEKFLANVADRIPPARAHQVIGAVLALDDAPSVTDLALLLRR